MAWYEAVKRRERHFKQNEEVAYEGFKGQTESPLAGLWEQRVKFEEAHDSSKKRGLSENSDRKSENRSFPPETCIRLFKCQSGRLKAEPKGRKSQISFQKDMKRLLTKKARRGILNTLISTQNE